MRRTSVQTAPEAIDLRLADPNLFRYPFLVLSGDRGFALPSEADIARLRRYITYGGFLLIDSCEGRAGGGFDESVRRLLAQTLPGELPIRIPEGHVLWKSFYVLHGAPGRIVAAPYLEGVERDRRLAVVYTQNDLGGAWARDGFGRWEHEVIPGGDDQREEAFRLGVNLVLYALCLDYKTEQAHIDYILRTRRDNARERVDEPFGHLPGGFNDWRIGLGAAGSYGRGGVALLVAAAVAAVALSALTLTDERPARGLVLLRAAHRRRARLPADRPRADAGAAPGDPRPQPRRRAGRRLALDGGAPARRRPLACRAGRGAARARRARAGGAAARRARRRPLHLRRVGLARDVGLVARAARPATPPASARRSASCARATPAAISGAVVLISDGIDTGRIGEGPIDAATRTAVEALGAPIHAVGLGEKSLRDLSIAAVLADELAFVRTPVTIEAVVRQTGLPDRQVEVTLERDGRPIATRGVILRGDRSEEKVSFDWLPDHPGNFVFRISTPVLTGEALASNNQQSFTLKVIRDRVRILHLAGRPSWDERFLRSMLRRDPNVDLVSFFILRTETDEQPWNHDDLSLIPFPTFEIFEEQLRSFDLVIFQNFNYAPYGVEPFLPNVRDYVEEGGAIAMVGGDLSFSSGGYGLTALRDVLPVELPPVAPDAGRGERSDAHHRFVQTPPHARGAHAPHHLAVARRARERGALGKAAAARGNQPGAARQGERQRRCWRTRRSRAPTESRRRWWWRATPARGGRWRSSPTASGTGAFWPPAKGTTVAPSNASGRTPSTGWCATRRSRCCTSSSSGRSSAAPSR